MALTTTFQNRLTPRELLARIRAVLRRQANELPGAPSQEEAVIAFGKFKLNLGTREMFREDGDAAHQR